MTKRTTHCTFCDAPLGQARLVVNDPNGISGTFCLSGDETTGCYVNARDHAKMVHAARLHADLETLAPVEGKRL